MNQRLMQILLSPHVSEKSAAAAEGSNQFVFKVVTDACKSEVKAAVELLFNVSVEDVRMLNAKGKSKRFGQVPGRRSDWKKAYVRVKEGQEIDFAGAN